MRSITILHCFLLILVLVLVPFAVADSYDEDGEGWIPEEDDTGDIDSDESGDYIVEDDIGSATTVFTEENPGFSVYLGMRVYCHNENREDELEDAFVASDEETRESYIYVDDFNYYLSSWNIFSSAWPYMPFDSDHTKDQSTFFVPYGDLYTWFSQILNVGVTTSSEDPFENAKIHRFEGKTEEGTRWEQNGCIALVGSLSKIGITEESGGTILSIVVKDKQALMTDHIEDDAVHATYDKSIGFNVNWDEKSTDCTAIDGAWTDASGYDDYACCGDDRMWIYNRAVNEEDGFEKPTISDDEHDTLGEEGGTSYSSFCLYGGGDIGEEAAITYVDIAADTYTCSQTYFGSYDSELENDNAYHDEAADDIVEKTDTFVFQGSETNSPEDETDIGKWSDSSGNNPKFCYYEYDESKGETYQWIDDINTIGDMPVNDQGEEVTALDEDTIRATTICEKYLGGKWTGGHCCGNKYDYNEDFGSVGYYDESFSEENPIYYNDGVAILSQYACLQGEIYEGKEGGTTIRYTKSDSTTVELLNDEGTWYGCNMGDITEAGEDWYKVQNGDDVQTLITSDTNITSCTVQGSYLCNYNYTDEDADGSPESEEWEWYSLTSADDEGDYVKDVLGYQSGDTFTSNPPETPWADTEGLQPYGCCAANRCWDGTQCVDETSQYTYTDSTATEVVAICSQGSWSGPKETKYDWYANTDAAAVDYCINNYACVCSTSEDDDTYCTDNEEYVVSGCTMTQDFYSNDHFCEAIDTDNNGNYTDDDDSSRWTSRTKFLAFQLLEIADGTEYTLFCDKYTNAVNNYVDLEPIEDEINSVCILKQEDTVTVGITLNSQDMAYPMGADLEETLFDSNGFIDAAVDGDVDNCDDAIAEDQTGYRFGKFFSCEGSTKVWYNSILNATIYSKDGLSASPSYPDTAYWQGILDTKKDMIVTYIEDNEPTNPAEQDLTGDFINPEDEIEMGMENIQDYNRFYYSTENSATIIGVEDIKYNGESGNRYYMAVLYDGPTLDCDQVYAPYEDIDPIFCDSTTGIVLERSTEGSAYWRSLTAGFRAE